VARFDQYIVGTRARLNSNWLDADVGKVLAVSLNANGKVIKGNPAGSTGIRGLVALGLARKAGHPVDLMRQGEILDIATTDIAGTLTMTAGTNLLVGFLVEIDRLVVSFNPDGTAGA
jgi:hypothetical protein